MVPSAGPPGGAPPGGGAPGGPRRLGSDTLANFVFLKKLGQGTAGSVYKVLRQCAPPPRLWGAHGRMFGGRAAPAYFVGDYFLG